MAKLYKLRSGESVVDEILAIAKREKIETARVEAIGGVRDATIAYFNHKRKKYEERRYKGFHEVTSMLGNVTLKDGSPFLHAHVNLGRKDLRVIGGHLVSATVHPFLEVVMTPTLNRAERRFDKKLGLNVII